MLTEFSKKWLALPITGSIATKKLKDSVFIHTISNSNKTAKVYAFEQLSHITAITDVLNVKPEDIKLYSFEQAVEVITEKLK